MKKYLLIFWILSALVVGVGTQGCVKDEDIFIPKDTVKTVVGDTSWNQDLSKINNTSTTTTGLLNIEKIANDLQTPTFTSEVNAENGGYISTPDNVTVNFPANSCTLNGRACTGKIDVEILVLRKKGDLVLNNVPTTSLDRQLISGGVVYVRASQNGQEVRLAREKKLTIRFKNPDQDRSMQLFVGIFDGRFKFDWLPIRTAVVVATGNGTTPTLGFWADTTQNRENKGYEIGLDRFGWINCDKFGDSTNLTPNFRVALPDTFTNQNTSVFVVFKDINSVVRLEGNPQIRQFMTGSGYRGLPIGRQVIIVTMSLVRGKYYLATQEATVTAGLIVRPTPHAATKDDIKRIVSSL